LKIELEKLMNLCHPCIVGPIGFVIVTELRELKELPELRVSEEFKIVRLYSEGSSLAEVILTNPV
jgi:hypothetical protein